MSGSELDPISQDSIDSLPDLAQIADVKKVQKNVNSEQTQAESIAASDKNTEIYYTPEEMDQLFLDVSDLADKYYSLEESQAKKVVNPAYKSGGIFINRCEQLCPGQRGENSVLCYIQVFRKPDGEFTRSLDTIQWLPDATDGKTRIAFCADSQASTPGGAGTSLVSEREITNQ